jgi:ABC-type transport system substrate-binding protein
MSAALPSSASRRPVRLLLALLLALVVGVGGNLAAWTAAQRPPEEYEDDKKPPRNEDEDTGAKVKHKAIRVDEPPEPAKTPTAGGPADVDLKTAARQATHPDIKKLFLDLAVPHDQVTIKNNLTADRDVFITPLEDYIEDFSKVKTSIKMRTFNNKWEKDETWNMAASGIRRIEYYEQLAQKRVKEFLDLKRQDAGPKQPKNLTRLEKLLAAEQALGAVARFHEAARAKETRKGSGWDDVRDALRADLLALVLERLKLSVDKGDWDEALAMAKQTAERFPTGDEQKKIAETMVPLVEQAMEVGRGENRFREVQRRLHELEELFPLSKAFEPVRNKLSTPAEELLKQARQLKDNGRLAEARKFLDQAEEIYPTLPGLHELRQAVEEEHPTLRVAVRDRPIFLSPARARTESERQAVELLFEGLVELGTESDGGRYRPALALGRPQMIALGRLFRLPRDAHWSDGQPVTSGDVQFTVRALRDVDWPGRSAAWADELFESAAPTDPFRIPLTLQQGYLEPLALMSFKVLPAGRLQKPDDEKFAKNPVGSGPFKFTGAQSDAKQRSYVQFSANPYYRGRPGAPSRNLPYIRDIQFFESIDPVKDLADRNVDMVLDLSSEAAVEAAKKPGVVVPPPMPSRRIWFLAINHRKPPLDNAALRRALNRAIPRQKLLDDYFRAGLGDKVHRPLNGPYPPGSWACDPKLEADLFNVDLAKGQMEQSKKKGVRLSLKYPSGDSAVAAAMASLRDHLKNTLDITLDLKALPLRSLVEAVEAEQDFELAYCCYDYPDPTFCLWPLLDSRSTQPGGRNYMGYVNAEMERLFRIVVGHRDFNEVRRHTHMIHRRFARRDVPFVPLWQLDRHFAFNSDVRLSDGSRELPVAAGTALPLDPLRIFATAGSWRVRRK